MRSRPQPSLEPPKEQRILGLLVVLHPPYLGPIHAQRNATRPRSACPSHIVRDDRLERENSGLRRPKTTTLAACREPVDGELCAVCKRLFVAQPRKRRHARRLDLQAVPARRRYRRRRATHAAILPLVLNQRLCERLTLLALVDIVQGAGGESDEVRVGAAARLLVERVDLFLEEHVALARVREAEEDVGAGDVGWGAAEAIQALGVKEE
mmetsp:Transcript_21275/g.52393  ORF Transcript_21275/g.52393 Transcript_21275/m.52393 type:complete len:210 (+) Transcript_21275:1250-1879(+)